MACINDKLVKALNSDGYQAILLPVVGIVPPELYNYTRDRRLVRRGPLKDYLPKSVKLPKPVSNPGPNFSVHETSSKSISGATSFLSAALQVIGISGTADINLSLAANKDLTFAFTGVTSKRIDPSVLDHVLSSLQVVNTAIPPEYIEAGLLHVAFEYLYCDTFLMKTTHGGSFQAGGHADVAELMNITGNVSVKKMDDSTIQFKAGAGRSPAAFAYKAGELKRTTEGRWSFYNEEYVYHAVPEAVAEPVRAFAYRPEMEPVLAHIPRDRGGAVQPFVPARGIVPWVETEEA